MDEYGITREELEFPDIREMVEIGSKTERFVDDIALTRYACYLIAQNGDSKKEELPYIEPVLVGKVWRLGFVIHHKMLS